MNKKRMPWLWLLVPTLIVSTAVGSLPARTEGAATYRALVPAVQRNYGGPWQCAEPQNDERSGACGPLESWETQHGYIGSSVDKRDWFWFYVPAPHIIEAWLTNIPAGNDYELYLMDAQGAILTYKAERGNVDEHILWGPVPPGRYYLVVLPADDGGSNPTQAYALRVAFVEATTTKLLGATGITLVYVPAGTYWMGSAESDSSSLDDEKPRHQVELGGYWMGQTEVTNAQYGKFIEAGGYNTRSFWSDAGWAWKTSNSITQPYSWGDSTWNGAEYPVVGVSWYEAEAYCRWAGGRLATEAEWEVAARGGPLSRGYRYSGSNNVGEVAWYSANSGGRTNVVKTKAANELGLHDMTGNVWEWVLDWYSGTYYATSPLRNPTGPSSGTYPVLRGGAWDNGPTSMRCALRGWDIPGDRSNLIGFRVAQPEGF